MMGRATWFVAGAGAGIYAMVKARRAAEAFTPDGLADRLAGLAVGAHLFGEEVRVGMAEKEHELRERLGLARYQPRHIALAVAPTEGAELTADDTDHTDDEAGTREGND